jgi:tyrosyl-tRNA synthetase
MNNKEKIELIKRNTVEVVNEDELNEVLKKSKPVVYCGYEVSGEVHLGHMVTTTKLLDFQKAGFKVKILFADWHTWLNKKGDWDEIHKLEKLWEKAFIGLGLDKAEFVLGSKLQRNMEYIDDVMQIAVKTTINRSLRSMQEVARDIEHAHVSQVIYPFMQIVDIKALKVDVAYSGIEQRKIHGLAREILPKLDYKAPVLVHTPLIPSLQSGEKMSSSKPESLISVRDSEEEIKKKIKKAYCVEGEVADNSILSIAKLIVFPRIKKLDIKRPAKFGGNVSFKSYEELEKAFVDKKLHPMDLKTAVGGHLIKILEPVRKVFS